ncbi:MAG TPA: hypothetical protein VM734_13740 [Kofleriaceae bacterium]|jgi:hypothetical protein|nr:hypothetical protein [Kofleriaceae bacterium]
MNTNNRYEEIAERNTVRRARDIAFALVLAAVTAFSLTSITAAARTASAAPAPAVQASPDGQVAGSCSVEPSC